MPRLSHREFDRLSNFLLDLYAFRDQETFVDHILTSLHNLIPCERISYNEMDLGRQHAVIHWRPDDANLKATIQPAFSRYMHEHPHVIFIQSSGDHSAHTISDFQTTRQFKNGPLYQEVYRVLEVQHQLTTALTADRSTLIPLALSRKHRDFSESHKQMLNLLRPHLAQAYRNARTVSRLKGQTALLDATLAFTGLAALQVDNGGTIRWATHNAAEHLQTYSRTTLSTQLPPLIREWFLAQAAAWIETKQTPSPQHPLLLTSAHGELTVRLLRDADEWWLILEERRSEVDLAACEQAGLSRRETEVLQWVAQGKTNDEIALVLGVRLATVKKHLERIYIKLGVETRMAAVARAKEICVHALD